MKVYVSFQGVMLMALNDAMTVQLQEVFEQSLIQSLLNECGTILMIMFSLMMALSSTDLSALSSSNECHIVS